MALPPPQSHLWPKLSWLKTTSIILPFDHHYYGIWWFINQLLYIWLMNSYSALSENFLSYLNHVSVVLCTLSCMFTFLFLMVYKTSLSIKDTEISDVLLKHPLAFHFIDHEIGSFAWLWDMISFDFVWVPFKSCLFWLSVFPYIQYVWANMKL